MSFNIIWNGYNYRYHQSTSSDRLSALKYHFVFLQTLSWKPCKSKTIFITQQWQCYVVNYLDSCQPSVLGAGHDSVVVWLQVNQICPTDWRKWWRNWSWKTNSIIHSRRWDWSSLDFNGTTNPYDSLYLHIPTLKIPATFSLCDPCFSSFHHFVFYLAYLLCIICFKFMCLSVMSLYLRFWSIILPLLSLIHVASRSFSNLFLVANW